MAGMGITSCRLLIVAGFVINISRKPNPRSDLEYLNIIAYSYHVHKLVPSFCSCYEYPPILWYAIHTISSFTYVCPYVEDMDILD
jgi:hypothetical protein